jgi:hypothetical protein
MIIFPVPVYAEKLIVVRMDRKDPKRRFNVNLA